LCIGMTIILSCAGASAINCEFNNAEANSEYGIPSEIPVSASEGQFIDKILLFEAPETEYIFDFNFTKNIRYDFFLQLFMPDVDLYIHATLVGMDADENEVEDIFELAQGLLIQEEEEEEGGGEKTNQGGFTFTCPMTGQYVLTLTGTISENTNVYFSVTDKGIVSSDDEKILDVNGYHDDQERQYYIDLKDDTIYSITVQRATTLSPEVVNSLSVSVDLYDFEGHIYHLIKSQPILSAFDDSDTLKEFGTAVKGQYRFVIHIDTDITVATILFTMKEEREIGDGPEVVEPTDLGDDKDPTLISISTIESFIPIGVGLFITLVAGLVYLGKHTKKRTPKIA
jgi:hypothetical protein